MCNDDPLRRSRPRHAHTHTYRQGRGVRWHSG